MIVANPSGPADNPETTVDVAGDAQQGPETWQSHIPLLAQRQETGMHPGMPQVKFTPWHAPPSMKSPWGSWGLS